MSLHYLHLIFFFNMLVPHTSTNNGEKERFLRSGWCINLVLFGWNIWFDCCNGSCGDWMLQLLVLLEPLVLGTVTLMLERTREAQFNAP